MIKSAYLCLNLFIEMELSIEEAKKLIEALPVYKSITDLEREIKLPKNSLQQFLKGKRKLPKKWVKPFLEYFKVGDKKEVIKVVEEKKENPIEKTVPQNKYKSESSINNFMEQRWRSKI